MRKEGESKSGGPLSLNSSNSGSSSFFDRSLHPFKGEREKRRRKNGAHGLAGGRGVKERKDDDQTCFLLPSFLSERSRSNSSAHIPDNRHSFSEAAGEPCAACGLATPRLGA